VSDSRLQEIFTKAVVGRAEHRMTWSHTVPAEGVTAVLGVHVSDCVVAVREGEAPQVQVLAEIDLWCADSRTTKVIRVSARHPETVTMNPVGPVLGQAEYSARLLGPVEATGVTVGPGGITLDLTARVLVEMSAVTRLWVKSYALSDAALDDVEDPDASLTSDSGSDE